MNNIRELNNISTLKKIQPSNMTDKDWQKHFNELRNEIKPSSERRMKTSHSISVNNRKDNTYFSYHGDTEWQYYCKFINSVLGVIRSGQCDYCYHIYQIADLLKFEHDRLKAVWLPEHQCFKVSLELKQKEYKRNITKGRRN